MIKNKLASAFRVLLTTGAVVIAGFVVWHLYGYYHYAPQTRDGKIRADIVPLATDISGTVKSVYVHDNQRVTQGTLLFSLDKERLTRDMMQAKATLEEAKATLNAAQRDYRRYLRLNKAVSVQEKDDKLDAQTLAKASLDKAQADFELSKINLQRADIYAPVDGIITNFSLRPGAYASAGVAIMALVDTNSFYVAGYFEETKLSRIHNGAKATIFVMGEDQPLYGHVEGLSAGINDSERTTVSGTLLANVNPTFSWIRLAQRIPVRIAIDQTPPDFDLIAGRTASISLSERTQ